MDSSKEYMPKDLKEKICKIWKNKCAFCDIDLSSPNFLQKQYHHFIPEVCNGETNIDNIVLCCYDCHSILHTKPRFSYLDLRMQLYTMFCNLLGIIPMKRGWDDDLKCIGDEIKEKGEDGTMDENWIKLYYLMRWSDYSIGGIDNGLKCREVLRIQGKIADKNLVEEDFLFRSWKDLTEEYFKNYSKDKQSNEALRGEANSKVNDLR